MLKCDLPSDYTLFNFWRSFLRRFVQDFVIKYFKRKYVGRRRFAQEWKDASDAYAARYRSIEEQLPESARLFERHIKRHPLHDEPVESISQPARGIVHVELEQRRLEFSGVTESEFPKPLEEAIVWLYEEIDLPRTGFLELRALFNQGEFRVVAREVRIFDKTSGRYVVPKEPDRPEPTLFQERKTKHSRKRSN